MTVEPLEGATPTAERDETSTEDAAPETASTEETPVAAGQSMDADASRSPTDGARTEAPDPASRPEDASSIPTTGSTEVGEATAETAGAAGTVAPEDVTTPTPSTAAGQAVETSEPEQAAQAQESAEATAIPPGAETVDIRADATQTPSAADDAAVTEAASATDVPTTDAGSGAGEAPSSAEAPTSEAPSQAAVAPTAEAGQTDATAETTPTEATAEATTEATAATPTEATAEATETEATAEAAEAQPPAEAGEAAPAPAPPARDPDRPEPTTMEELLSEQTDEIRSLKHGDVVEGNVVRIDKDEILVDIGAKSEGVVSNRELYGRNAETQPQLNIGDTVLVYVLQPESNEGHAVLSLRRAGLERKWRAMQEQLDAGVIIEAPVIDHNKGGLIVDCGIRGFVPISQIVDFPRRPQNEQPRDAAQEIAEKLQPYVGRRLRLKILEVNRKANRLILSEKVALYEERREKRDELFSSLQVGQRVKGTVRSIAPFGVFVDLGGIDGLVHKSELSWNKVNNPEAGYRVGEEVEAEVIDINHERGRISLSIRRLQPDPWHSTVADLKVGDIIEGTVTKIVNFGSFVRVRDGLEGLIHISELSHQRVAHPGDVVHEGQKLDLKVISLDSERHRLGLSLKQAEEAPARPAPTAPEPRERRGGRQERSFDASQAVQEPEEGIDNTLAAAFAQVRQQVAESEAAAAQVEEAATGDASVDTTATAEPATTVEAAAAAEPSTEAPAAEDQTTASAEAAAATADAAAEATPTEEATAAETTAAETTAAETPASLADEPGAADEPVAEASASEAEPVAPAAEQKPAGQAKSSARSKRAVASPEATPAEAEGKAADAEVAATDDETPAADAEVPAATDEAPGVEAEAAAADAEVPASADGAEAAATDEAPAAKDRARS